MRRLALLFVVAVLLTACNRPDAPNGTGEPESPPTAEPTSTAAAVERVADAASTTLDAGSARFHVRVDSLDMAVSGGEAGEEPAVEGEGEEDFEAQRRRITTRGALGQQEIIVDGPHAYVRLPARGMDQWGRIDLNEVAAEPTVGVGGPAGLALRGSGVALGLLRDAVTDAVDSGEDEVDGVPTTRYEATVDLQAAAEAAGDGAGAAIGRFSEGRGSDELPLEVWVDDDDLVRRIVYRGELTRAGAADVGGRGGAGTEEERDADPVSGSVTVTYSDFGDDVDITLPDDELIFDLPT